MNGVTTGDGRPPNASPPAGQFVPNLLLFGRVLHGLGLDVSLGRMMDLTVALSHIELGRRMDFYHATRSLLVHRREDLALFDEAFNLFWQAPREGHDIGMPMMGTRRKRPPRTAPPPLGAPDQPPPDDPLAAPNPSAEPVIEVTKTYSAAEALRRKDFAQLTPAEYAAIKALMAQLTWALGQRRTRRKKPGGGPRLDLRRTLRRSLKHGGNVLEWSLRQPKLKPRPVVLLADISGSMERYTRLLLHFLYGLARGLGQPVEAFVFGTRLTRITRQLHLKNVERALREVSLAVPDWSGGTRIGEALKTFNYHWCRRVLGRGAVVIVISDGWDRGDPALLAVEMARLRRSAYRLIWLNPLLGAPQYEPLTRGLQAALPHVDDFMPVHNLASLEDLAEHLASLDGKRRR